MILKFQTSEDTSDTISSKFFYDFDNEIHNQPILPPSTESQLHLHFLLGLLEKPPSLLSFPH